MPSYIHHVRVPVRDHISSIIVIPADGLGVLVFVAIRIYTRLMVMKLGVGLDG
jgi:hypothetical protein